MARALRSHHGSLRRRASGNNSLADLDGLPSADWVFNLEVIDNDSLLNVNAFSMTTTVGNLEISGNNALENIDGLANLSSASGSFTIASNSVLGECCGIYDILKNSGIQGPITIEFNASGCDSLSDVLDSCNPTSVEFGDFNATVRSFSVRPSIFRNAAGVRFSITATTRVTILVYDVRGHLVRTLADRAYDRGAYSIPWQGNNNQRLRVPAGVYFVRFSDGVMADTQKVIRIR